MAADFRLISEKTAKEEQEADDRFHADVMNSKDGKLRFDWVAVAFDEKLSMFVSDMRGAVRDKWNAARGTTKDRLCVGTLVTRTEAGRYVSGFVDSVKDGVAEVVFETGVVASIPVGRMHFSEERI